MLKLAEITGSKLASPSENTNAYGSNGLLIDSQKVSEGFEIFWDIVTEAFKYSNENCADIPSQTSLIDFIRKRLAEREKDDESRDFILELAEMWGGFVGDSVRKQSLKWFWLEECLDGGKTQIFYHYFCLEPTPLNLQRIFSSQILTKPSLIAYPNQ